MRRLFGFAFFAVLLLPAAVLAERLDVSFPDFSPLRYDGPKCDEQDSGWAAGEKLPVLDDGHFVGKCPELAESKGFSVAMVFRPLEIGSKRGNNGAENAMLVTSGTGYYDGWRLLLENFKRKTPCLEIGREGGSWRISSSLPITGSNFPSRARAVRSLEYWSRIESFLPSGAPRPCRSFL